MRAASPAYVYRSTLSGPARQKDQSRLASDARHQGPAIAGSADHSRSRSQVLRMRIAPGRGLPDHGELPRLAQRTIDNRLRGISWLEQRAEIDQARQDGLKIGVAHVQRLLSLGLGVLLSVLVPSVSQLSPTGAHGAG